MRQIKLRAWDKHSKKMVILRSINLKLKIAMVYPKGSTSPRYLYQASLDELDLMQLTGFTDSEDREIYEGDIVKIAWDDGESFHAVKWFGENGYQAFDLDPQMKHICANGLSYAKACAVIEVVGNIHETQEKANRLPTPKPNSSPEPTPCWGTLCIKAACSMKS